MLDTICTCQSRQDWYLEYAVSDGHDPMMYVRSARISDDPASIAHQIRATLGVPSTGKGSFTSGRTPLQDLIQKTEEAGVMVMVSGCADNNPRRKLDPAEFLGFALSDYYASVVFVNGAGAKASQRATLANALAHLWLGTSGLFSYRPKKPAQSGEEAWCNEVAAELLFPKEGLLSGDGKTAGSASAGHMPDCGGTGRDRQAGGRTPHPSVTTRASKRFTAALVHDTVDKETSYREALKLLCVDNCGIIDELATALDRPD